MEGSRRGVTFQKDQSGSALGIDSRQLGREAGTELGSGGVNSDEGCGGSERPRVSGGGER